MSQRVLFMRLNGAIFPNRTSSPDQCGASTASGRNGIWAAQLLFCKIFMMLSVVASVFVVLY
jgi:hypothetical protein